MLDALDKMGLLKKENGTIDEKTKIVLLHIYKSRLEGKKTDIKGILNQINANDISSYSQLLSKDIDGLFCDGFESGIEKMHNMFREKRIQSGRELGYGASQKFDEIEQSMETLKLVTERCGALCESDEQTALKFLPKATRYIVSSEIRYGQADIEIN